MIAACRIASIAATSANCTLRSARRTCLADKWAPASKPQASPATFTRKSSVGKQGDGADAGLAGHDASPASRHIEPDGPDGAEARHDHSRGADDGVAHVGVRDCSLPFTPDAPSGRRGYDARLPMQRSWQRRLAMPQCARPVAPAPPPAARPDHSDRGRWSTGATARRSAWECSSGACRLRVPSADLRRRVPCFG